MAKDPAFLFYSKEFYEGTRTLLPEERACYVDLLVYQHQHGIIPDDPKRMSMYCSGISEATLQATLEAKFKRTDSGWVNDTLMRVMDDRKEYSEKQAVNGRIGQFWKKAKSALSPADYKKLRAAFSDFSLEETHSIVSEIEPTKEGLKGWLKRSLSRTLSIADANAIANTNTEEERKGDARGKTEIDLEVSEIISHLNAFADTDFTVCDAHATHINARIKEGYTVETLKEIIEYKTMEWKGDPKMSKYLRPATLFNSSKAAIYRDEVANAKRTGQRPKTNNGHKHQNLAAETAAALHQMQKEGQL